MTNQQQQTQTRHLKIRRAANGYRPGEEQPEDEPQLAEKALNLHFIAPAGGRDASDEDLALARALRDRLEDFGFVKDACRCQDEGTVGVKFKVAGAAVNFDQLLTRVFHDLRELEDNELLRRPGARWRATYGNGALADEGPFKSGSTPGASRS